MAERTRELQDAVNQRLATEDLVRTIMDNIPGRIAYWDLDGRCRFVNRAWCDWFGIPRERAIGRTVDELFDQERVLANRPRLERVLRGEEQVFEREEVGAGGQAACMQLHYHPHVVDGTPRGFFVRSARVTCSFCKSHARSVCVVCAIRRSSRIDGITSTKLSANMKLT